VRNAQSEQGNKQKQLAHSLTRHSNSRDKSIVETKKKNREKKLVTLPPGASNAVI